MNIPGSDLLERALTVIAMQSVTYRRYAGRTTTDAGKYVAAYDAPTTLQGSFQPIKRRLYQAMGLDLQKNYANFYVSADLIDVQRGVSGDQIIFNGRLWQCESLSPWFGVDGWVGVLVVDVGPAPDVIECLFPLGAPLATIQGYFGPTAALLTQDATKQIGSCTLAGSLGTQWDGYAMADGTTIALDAAGTALDILFTNPVTGGVGGGSGVGTGASMAFYSGLSSSVIIAQFSLGTGQFRQVVAIDGVSVFEDTNETAIQKAGVRFTGTTVAVKFDDTEVTLSSNSFMAMSVVPVQQITEYQGLPAGDAGKLVSVNMVTDAVTTPWQAGTKNACGSVLDGD